MSRTRGSLILIGARAIGSIVGLLAIPIYARILGDKQFGAAIFVQYLVPFFLLLDFGFQEAAQRQIAQLRALEQLAAQWLVHRVHKFVCQIIAVVILALALSCGLLLTIKDSDISRSDTILLFTQLGVLMSLTMLYQPVLSIIIAYENFSQFAKISALASLVGTITSLGLVFVWRSANAIVAGMLFAQILQYSFGAMIVRNLRGDQLTRATWETASFRSFARVALQDFPNRVLLTFAQNADKLIFSNRDGVLPLSLYRKASRAPDSLAETLMMMNGAIFPGWNRDYSTDRNRFYDSVCRVLTLVLFASGVVLIVPMGFSEPFLRIYLGSQYRPEMALVCAFVGIYQAFQVYFTALGYALHVAGKRYVTIPLNVFNAIATVFGTWPVYRTFGIAGVGAMNAAISILQLPVAAYLLRHSGLPKAGIRKHLLDASFVLGLLVLALGAGACISQVNVFAKYPAVAVAVAPVLMLAVVYVAHFLQIVAIPNPIKRRLGLATRQPPVAPT